MRLPTTALSAVFVLLTACAVNPGSQVPQRSINVSAAEVDLLADLMRREDNRQYDSTAFHGFLTQPSDVVRTFAVRALGRIGNRSASGQLVNALNDASEDVRADAAFALGELGDTAAHIVEALGSASRRNAGSGANEAVAALGKLRTEGARAHVETILSRGERARLPEALLSIWRFPRKTSSTQLVTRYVLHDDPEIRWRATYALTRGQADPAVVPLLIDAVQPRRTDLAASFAARGLRAAAVDSANMRTQARAALLARIADTMPAIRINSIVALGGYRDSTVAGVLIPLLAHTDVNTRVAVAQTLANVGGSIVQAALEGRARHASEPPVVRGTALSSLVTQNVDRGLAVAGELANSDQWLLRLYAARAASAASATRGLSMLRQLANDRDARVAVAAVEAAAGTRDTLPEARALFIEQLAVADPFVRAAALGGLERYADLSDQILLFDAYARALRDTVPEAAVAAVDAIAKLLPKNAAVDRAFRVRFVREGDCPHPDIRRALSRHFQVTDACGVTATARVYEQVVRDLVAPALSGTNPRARITTAGSVIEIELLAADAPLTVRNFMSLAQRGYFNGGRWHRVVPNFVIQDGDPYGNGSGGPGYAIRDEMNRVRYLEGAMGMALSGPDTGGSQFFITHSPQPHLDGGYTVFGRVRSGPFHHIAQDDVIERIEIVR